MLDLLLRPAVLTPVVVLVSYTIYAVYQAIWPSHLPRLPVVGTTAGSWLPPLLQARWQNSNNYKAVADEINTLYRNKSCLVPIGGSETIVLLPASETQHIVDQPDTVLNMPQPMIQGLQFKYTVADRIIIEEPIHQKIVSSNLTHQIANMVDDMVDETAWSFEKYWGSDTTEFKDVVVFETIRRIVGSITNRAFVGLPACRDPGLVDAGMSYARDLPEEARKLRMLPPFLKPLLAPFHTKGTRKHTKDFYRIIMPTIEARLREYDRYLADPSNKSLVPPHNDFLQWSIAQAKSHPDSARMAHPSTLAGRVLMLNFGAIHTTSFALTHAIFDLFSHSSFTIYSLRSEISHALSSPTLNPSGFSTRTWTKRALSHMPLLDSCLRESLRLNLVSTFGVPRLVISPRGFTTISGVHIPPRNIVAVPGKNIAKDPAVYQPDPETYRPFRFAEKRADFESTEYVKRAQQTVASTSVDYLPFGHGKHACPGRFFAASEMKIVLGWLAMNYEVEMLDKRPEDLYVGPARLPPMTATVRVRRRREGE